MRAIIFDYGAGNLHSLAKAVSAAGATPIVESDPHRVAQGDFLILPGVGAFGHAAARLLPARMAVRQALLDGLPCLGICLGMQLLFAGSEEGDGQGLGVVPGMVTRLRAGRVPQIGWNRLESVSDDGIRRAGLVDVYYANSFVGRPDRGEQVTGWSEYQGDRFAAAVRVSRTVGVQFHPEKSSAPGLRFLEAVFSAAAR